MHSKDFVVDWKVFLAVWGCFPGVRRFTVVKHWPRGLGWANVSTVLMSIKLTSVNYYLNLLILFTILNMLQSPVTQSVLCVSFCVYRVNWTLCRRGSIDVNSDAGKNQAEALLNELMEKIESTYSHLQTQDSYDLAKSLDFQCAKDDFRVRICTSIIFKYS